MTEEKPTMFHYLLEMHREGKTLMSLELNVPTNAFAPTKMNFLMALEAVLVEEGERRGFKKKHLEETSSLPLEASNATAGR